MQTKSNALSFSLLLFLLMMLNVQTKAQMYVSGRFLYSQDGVKVIPRGLNEMFIYAGDKSGYNTYTEIKKTNSNMVRITWNTSGSAADLKNCIYNCITRGQAIAMVTLNDATGTISKVQTCVDYWKRSDVKAAMQDFKKWTILNIANEAGDGNVSDQTFKDTYKSAISQLRTAGYTVPIVVDASTWGQDFEIIKRTWSEIFNSDNLRRTMFSVHTYWNAGGNDKINNLANDVKNNNIPFLIGEGPQQTGSNCNYSIDYKYAMQRFQENEIGWLAWSWGVVKNGDCQANRNFDITTDGIYGNWVNQWAKDIIYFNSYSIQSTSRKPASLTASNPLARVAAVEYEPIPSKTDAEAFPNPANMFVTVPLPNDIGSDVQLEVIDMMGINVLKNSYSVEPCDRNLNVNVESLKKGNYILRTTRGEKNLSVKISIVD